MSMKQSGEMSKSAIRPSEGDERLKLDALVASILSNEIAIFDLLGSAPSGDYWAFVQRERLFRALSREPRVLGHFVAELRSKIVEAGGNPDDDAITKELTRKDGLRRFSKLENERSQAFSVQPSLLSGETFEACLEQYKALIAYVESLWADASQLYNLGNFPLATFLSILVIEEVGKLTHLALDLVSYDMPRTPTQGDVVERSHRRKHFIGVMSGALINARLDRVLGKDVIRKILHQAESDELERIRQSCLYIDMQDGRIVAPSGQIDAECARVLTVLAGELMAEVLGHFPWEFERMHDTVVAFERAIGMPEKKIKRR